MITFRPGAMLLLTLISIVAATPAPSNPTFFNTMKLQPVADPVAISRPCLAAEANANGAAVTIVECNTITDDPSFWTWNVIAGGAKTGKGPVGPITIFDDKCLDVTDGVDENGTKLQIWECTGGKNQLFNLNSAVPNNGTITWASSSGNKCVDLTNGDQTPGNQVQIWDCGENNVNQLWVDVAWNVVFVTEQLRLYDLGNVETPLCLTAQSNEDGAPVIIDTCTNPTFTSGNNTWTLEVASEAPGQIKTFGGTKCLDVTNGVGQNGTKMQIWTCAQPGSNPNQIFISGSLSVIGWEGSNLCLDVTDGNRTPGNQIQLWACTAGENQVWNGSIWPLPVTA